MESGNAKDEKPTAVLNGKAETTAAKCANEFELPQK